jgi:hypothetical protein
VTDNYRARLEAELASIRTRRINIRRQLDQISRGVMHGDVTHTATLRTNLEIQLRGTQARFEELHHMLGTQHKLGPAVKFDVPVRRHAVAPVRRSVPVPNYITRDMKPGR